MANIPLSEDFSVDFPAVEPGDTVVYTAENEKLSRLLSNDQHLKNKVDDLSNFGVVFSPTRPPGDWSLWLQDKGEIPGYEDEDTVTLDTAPLDAPGDFALMYSDTEGETIVNMTDDPESAGDNDIIIEEQ